jgi:uncharacterized protein (TIGR02145 family)
MPILSWNPVDGADGYGVQVSMNPDFISLVFDRNRVDTTICQVTGLSGGTKYFWRVSAEIAGEKSRWSVTRSFTTEAEQQSVADIDGNVYRTIRIGDQMWMAENLRVTHYRNGDPIPCVTNQAAWDSLTDVFGVIKMGVYCDYSYNPDFASTYGHLYSQYAVKDSRCISPLGWHAPSFAECQRLFEFLGGFSAAGGRLKEAGTSHWEYPNAGATNESGFSALPSGYNTIFGMTNIWRVAQFYSSTEDGGSHGLQYWTLSWYDSTVQFGDYYKVTGNSVRLIRD